MEKAEMIKMNEIDQLPSTDGVYLFYDKNSLIYIGKAVNLRSRVKNHFQQPSYRDNLFISKVTRIGFINTESEIEALILEANLIKKHLPKFNVVWKDDKNYFFVAITKEEKPIVFITHQKNQPRIEYIGPFIEGTPLKKTLKLLRKVFPYYTTSKHPKNKCTWCHLDLCPGPNPDLKEYQKNIKKLILVLQGKRNAVLNSLKKEMKTFSDASEFERAADARNKMVALQQVMSHRRSIQNAPLATANQWNETQKAMQEMIGLKNTISRVECYDISNIQGKQAVGSMVVFTNGASDKNQYRKFKIKMKNEPNDIAMLKEVLGRRMLRDDWKYPEVMLIDGGKAQLNVAISQKNLYKNTQHISIISIAKGRRELFIEGKQHPIPLKDLPQGIYNLILGLDDEAHRFAITYHKKLRKKYLLAD